MPFCLAFLLIQSLSTPPTVGIVVLDKVTAERAEQLHTAVAKDPRFRIDAQPLHLQGDATNPDFSRSQKLLEAARQDYIAMAAGAAHSKLAENLGWLLEQVHHPQARSLLAQSLRLEGLIALLSEQKNKAKVAFTSASFLDAGYTPDESEWPPAARLAYSDAAGAARRNRTGKLSVQVKPTEAILWLDGEMIGAGSTTLSDLGPGNHFLLARSPGHRSVAALVAVSGGGQLDTTSIFLEPLPAPQASQQLGKALTETWGTPSEKWIASKLCSVTGVEALLVVGANNNVVTVTIFNQAGARIGAPLPIDDATSDPDALHTRLRQGPQSIQLTSGVVAIEDGDEEWYESWQLWTALGAGVAIIGGIAIYYAAQTTLSNDVDFVIGQQP